jgi:hypothetical protein
MIVSDSFCTECGRYHQITSAGCVYRKAYVGLPEHILPQRSPNNVGERIAPLVANDILQREQFGIKKYGQPLCTDSGRDALWDAYQEALDLCMYLRQRIEQEKRTHDDGK